MRLREVCTELLGPLHHGGAPPLLQGSPSTATAGAPAGATASTGGERAAELQRQHGWQPTVLGLDKRALLRGELLRDIGRNRANQRLVNEFAELLAHLPPQPAGI